MMTDLLTWSPINLGRWAGTQVRIHFLLLLFAAYKLIQAAVGPEPVQHSLQTLAWLALLLIALAIHELGHAVMASRLGHENDEIRLWPLGNMVGPTASYRNHEPILVALAGPMASALMVVGSAITLGMLDAQFVWNPFGNPNDAGAPFLNALKPPYTVVHAFRPAWWIGWFGYLNWVILLANVIPALPFDAGRALRAFMASSPMVGSKDTLIAPWLARSFALILFIGGMIRLVGQGVAEGKATGRTGSEESLALIFLAVLIEWMVRTESRAMEDGGFFDDGVFGYDFSEGYTSLESSTAKVRPYRESALKRWRRRRSELRRERRQARETAEDRRLDEILEKLHLGGRSVLTEEEHHFLVRVSAKIRNRPKADG